MPDYNIGKILPDSIRFIEKEKYESFDLFDALTCSWIDKSTKQFDLARRITIQMCAKSPFNLHRFGMKKMIHTKLISDLLWTFSLKNSYDKAFPIYERLIDLKCKDTGFVWGLNFPYTSRFINADANTPNIYNTATVGLSICEFYHLNKSREEELGKIIHQMIDSLFLVFTFNDEDSKGWFSYYPGQKSPTYNVNALAAYFLCKANQTIGQNYIGLDVIQKLIHLLIEEQNSDGSWYYSRSNKGKWIDGFHSGFIIESLAYIYSHGFKSIELQVSLEKAWEYYIQNLFTPDGFPKYFSTSNKYPIEAQNCAQAIQTLSLVGLWLGWHEKELLRKLIGNTVENLYNHDGYFYFKKNRFYSYKQSYLRWSTSPMLVALSYADIYLEET